MRAERAFCPVKRFDAAGRSHFSVHQGSGLFARSPCRKDLKVFRLPASLLLVCKQGYLTANPLPKTIDDLSEMDWIGFRQFPINKQLTNTKGEMPRINPEVSIEVDGVVALCQMAKSALGTAAVPKVIIQDDLDSGDLIALNPNWRLKQISLYAVWPNDVSEESLTLLFVRFLADRMASGKH